MDRVTNYLPFNDAKGKFSFRTMFSYIFDYAVIIVLAILYAILDKVVTPFAQEFSVDDISIQYTFAVKERIPILDAILISGAFPLVVIIIYTLFIDGAFSHSGQKGFKKYSFKQRLWELNCGVLGLFLAQGAAFVVTGTLKNLIGRPRPDLLSRCIIDQEKVKALAPFTLATRDLCTQKDFAIMQDGFRSFPSGHSSSSFGGLGYLSLYLGGKLHVLDHRGEVWRTVIFLIPLLAASCIAASRVMDFRHHPTDVLIGSALGLLVAWGAYRQYFPPLSHSWLKGRAYPMREWGVKMRQPDDYHGTGYTSGLADRSGEAISRHGPAEELPFYNKYPAQRGLAQESYGLEPMRPVGRPDMPSPGFDTIPAGDDTDYEVVRSRAQESSPSEGISRQGTGSPNVFRDQIHKNQSQRRPDEPHIEGHSDEDEEDLGVGHRRPLVRPGMI